MKQKRCIDEQRNPARPVFPAGSRRLAARQEPPSQRAVVQRHADAVQASPTYFSHALSRWSTIWGGSFYDLIAIVERFSSIPSLAALDVSISQQLNLETDGASEVLEGP